MEIKKLFDTINLNKNYLVVPNQLKTRLLTIKSTLESRQHILYKFKILTESELLELLTFKVNSNLILNEFESNQVPFSITTDKIQFARYTLDNPNHPLTQFIQNNQQYLTVNYDFIKQCSKIKLHFMFEPIYFIKFLNLYDINYTVHNLALTKQPLIYQFNDLLSEITYLFESIAALLEKNISSDKIYLTGLSQTNYPTILKLSRFYNIPIKHHQPLMLYDLKYTKSLLQKPIDDIIKTVLDQMVTDQEILLVHEAVINILNRYDYKRYIKTIKDILIYELKRTNYLNHTPTGINVIDIKEAIALNQDDYLFVIGTNYGTFPHLTSDNQYLSDKDKLSIGYPSSSQINQNQNLIYGQLLKLNQIQYISFATKDSYNEYAPSDILNNYLSNDQVVKKQITLSDLKKGYAKDLYKLIFATNDSNNTLLTTFDNKFSLTDKQLTNVLSYIKVRKITLSPSHLSTYLKSPFIYYVRHILKISNFEDNVATMLGTFFHAFIEVVFRIKFEKIVKFKKEDLYNQQLKDIIDDFIFEFDESNSVSQLFDKFYSQYFLISHTNDETLVIRAQFFIQKNRQILISAAERLVSLEEIQKSISIHLEEEFSSNNFKGYADIVRVNKDKQFSVFDYKSSDKTAFTYQKIVDFITNLETNQPVTIALIDLLQLIFYANLLVKEGFGKFNQIGFYTFLEENSKINGLTINEFSEIEKQYYQTQNRVISNSELDNLLDKIDQIANDVLDKINQFYFPNQLIKQTSGQDKLETNQFAIYQAIAFYTKYAQAESEDDDEE